MPVIRRLLPAIAVGSGVILGVAGVAVESRAIEAVMEARRAEIAAVGRQVRATAIALGLELPVERAAALASEGLEASFPGGWRWLHLPEKGGPPGDPTFHAIGPVALERLRAGETVVVSLGPEEARRDAVLTALPVSERGGPRLCLELSLPESELEGVRDALTREVATAVTLAIALITLMTALFGRIFISAPLREIRELARRAGGGGDPGLRLPLGNRGGELEELARDMNTMCDRLARFAAEVAETTRQTEDAHQHLRRAERLASVGKLAAGLAHELGTPLNVITARAKALARTPAEPAEVERQAAIIARQAERVAGIVRQLLDFSRRRAPHMAPVDVADAARAVAQLLGPGAGKADVAIHVAAALDLPKVTADAAQLEQVLVNLVLNAVQATPGGGEVRIAIDRATERPPRDLDTPAPFVRGTPLGAPVDVVRISVVDEGIGIARDHLPQLFDPFFTTKAPGEGTGLGLPVAWGIVREHGGWFDVASVEGEGSRFTVHLPLLGPEARARAVAPPASMASASEVKA